MWSEFKKFAIKSSAVDLAIGVIIGASFSKVISSLVADVAMPPIGIMLGGIDFKGFYIVLKPAMNGHAAITLNYGMFINTLIDFIIVISVIFFVIKIINQLHFINLLKGKECPYCISTISKEAIRCKSCTSEILK